MHCIKTKQLVTISCPGSVFYLSDNCTLATVPNECIPPFIIKVGTTCITNGNHQESGNVQINTDGRITYSGNLVGAYELAFCVTYLCNK